MRCSSSNPWRPKPARRIWPRREAVRRSTCWSTGRTGGMIRSLIAPRAAAGRRTFLVLACLAGCWVWPDCAISTIPPAAARIPAGRRRGHRTPGANRPDGRTAPQSRGGAAARNARSQRPRRGAVAVGAAGRPARRRPARRGTTGHGHVLPRCGHAGVACPRPPHRRRIALHGPRANPARAAASARIDRYSAATRARHKGLGVISDRSDRRKFVDAC